ncbi:hypothetical protein ACIBEJ_00540 [Nonomuraea sp. NPDC050790]|uniref:hypothetical protein n=1 Tax=Nonomuraea sp. NPDC050790 TaxID=3364371 RepID=UPI0037A07737
MEDLARRFPLVPAGRQRLVPFAERVRRVKEFARIANGMGRTALKRGADALGGAAMILADGGHSHLARHLLWQHVNLFRAGRPFTVDAAKLALEPLINLGRLQAQQGDAYAAHQTFESLLNGVRTLGEVKIDGRSSHLQRLVVSADHAELVRWVWQTLYQEHTRALTQSGQWSEALKGITQRQRVSRRLLECRQVAVLAQPSAEISLRMIADSSLEADWETPVAACLRVLSLARAGRRTSNATDTMTSAFLQFRPPREHPLFYTRLGLTVYNLAAGSANAPLVAEQLRVEALAARDAFAAHEILPLVRTMPEAGETVARLTQRARRAELGEVLPPVVVGPVMETAWKAMAAIEIILAR